LVIACNFFPSAYKRYSPATLRAIQNIFLKKAQPVYKIPGIQSGILLAMSKRVGTKRKSLAFRFSVYELPPPHAEPERQAFAITL
jgi:hypothetical protein